MRGYFVLLFNSPTFGHSTATLHDLSSGCFLEDLSDTLRILKFCKCNKFFILFAIIWKEGSEHDTLRQSGIEENPKLTRSDKDGRKLELHAHTSGIQIVWGHLISLAPYPNHEKWMPDPKPNSVVTLTGTVILVPKTKVNFWFLVPTKIRMHAHTRTRTKSGLIMSGKL